jgi:hypothetical protein
MRGLGFGIVATLPLVVREGQPKVITRPVSMMTGTIE